MNHYDVKPLPGMHPEIGLMAAMLEDATREWREQIENPPIEAIIYQPLPNGHSMGAVLLHMIDVEIYWIEEFLLKRPRDLQEQKILLSNETRQDDVHWPTPPRETWEWYLDLQDTVRQRTLIALKDIKDPDRMHTDEKWDYSDTDRWVVNHVVGHESYHGGQVVLCNLMYEATQR